MSFACTRRFQFCAGHRVWGHESKCNNLHGHNYVALVTAEAKSLDNIGRVIDFSCLKDVIGNWIDVNWDHGLILCREDPWVKIIQSPAVTEAVGGPAKVIGNKPRQKLFLMTANPTAENMALLLKEQSTELLKCRGVEVTRVVLWETENCNAEA